MAELVREVEVVTEVRMQPDWLIGAQVGAGSVGVLYRDQAARRILGPVYLSAGVLAGGRDWVGTAGLALAF